MNESMVDFSVRVPAHQQNNNSEFGNNTYCEFIDINHAWNIGSCSQTLAGEGGHQQSAPPKSSATIMSRFESPASAFYATERCMGFQAQQYDSQLGNPSLTSQFSKMNDMDFPLYQSIDPTFEFSNTLQALVKSPLSSTSNQYYCRSPEKSNNFSHRNLSTTNKFLPFQQNSLLVNDAASVKRKSPYMGNQDHTMGFSSPQHVSEGSVATVSGNQGSNGTQVSSSKTRIRWNQDLHDKFVECVNRLGGAERKNDKRSSVEDVHNLDPKTGLQLREALQMQLDVQRRLHEQLEVQRKLQLRIEEQGRQLKKMFDEQQKTSDSIMSTQNLSNIANDNNETSSNSHKDVELSTSEGYGNSFLPSKIS